MTPSQLYTIHVTTYWTSCALFMLLDWKTSGVNRIVPVLRARHPPSAGKIAWAAVISAINQVLAYPLVMLVAPYCEGMGGLSLGGTALQFVFYALVADQWFYWTHRIMHQPWLYQNIHRIHHQWTYPMAIRTIYAHPVEHLIVNTGSILIGPLLWNGSTHVLTVWIILATINAVGSHSGTHVPFCNIEKHDLHHRYLTCNYGTSGISDRLYGTRRFGVSPNPKID